MIHRFLKLQLSLLLVFAASGCAAQRYITSVPCKGLDWFEIGRRDGAIGRPADTLERHIRDCERGELPNADLYLSGRNAGLVDYCTAQTGFDFGRAGTPYLLVCPEHLEKKFLPGYVTGRRQFLQEEDATRARNRASNSSSPNTLR